MARIFAFLVGLALTAFGWSVIEPSALAGVGRLALGTLEAYRTLIGGAIAGLGGIVALGSIFGHRDPPRRKPRATPLVFDFDAEPATAGVAAPETAPDPSPFYDAAHEAEEPAPQDPAPFPPESAPSPEPVFQLPPEPEPFPEPVPEPEAAPQAAVEPVAPEPTHEAAQSFGGARESLRALAREENWPAVGRVLAMLPRLAANDTEQALAAQDLGTFYRSQGKADDAAEAYDTALSFARDSGDATLLAAALTDVGDVALEQSRLETAIGAYEDLLRLRRAAVEADPGPENRRLLSLALERLGDAREDRGHRTRALGYYQESYAIAADLAAADPAKYGADLTITRRRLSEIEAALA